MKPNVFGVKTMGVPVEFSLKSILGDMELLFCGSFENYCATEIIPSRK